MRTLILHTSQYLDSLTYGVVGACHILRPVRPVWPMAMCMVHTLVGAAGVASGWFIRTVATVIIYRQWLCTEPLCSQLCTQGCCIQSCSVWNWYRAAPADLLIHSPDGDIQQQNYYH